MDYSDDNVLLTGELGSWAWTALSPLTIAVPFVVSKSPSRSSFRHKEEVFKTTFPKSGVVIANTVENLESNNKGSSSGSSNI